MILYQIPILILTLSLVSIFIAPDEPYAFNLFFKLLPMIIIIGYAFRLVPREKRAVHWFILIGLVLSIVGDATTLWFPFSLIAYFLAHLCYAVGLFTVHSFQKSHLFLFIPIGMYTLLFSSFVALMTQEKGFVLTLIISYIILISITLSIAVSTRNKPVILGAFLYIISHSILLWSEFVQPISYGEDIGMFIYYVAQFFIAISLHSLIERNQRIIW